MSYDENAEVMAVYKEKLPESYERFAVVSGCMLIKIDLRASKSWKAVNKNIETTTIDFVNESITNNII